MRLRLQRLGFRGVPAPRESSLNGEDKPGSALDPEFYIPCGPFQVQDARHFLGLLYVAGADQHRLAAARVEGAPHLQAAGSSLTHNCECDELAAAPAEGAPHLQAAQSGSRIRVRDALRCSCIAWPAADLPVVSSKGIRPL